MNVIQFPPAIARMIPAFQDIRIKDTSTAGILAYENAGGIVHKFIADGKTALCKSLDGIAVQSRWKRVTCLACFRIRANVRKALGK